MAEVIRTVPLKRAIDQTRRIQVITIVWMSLLHQLPRRTYDNSRCGNRITDHHHHAGMTNPESPAVREFV